MSSLKGYVLNPVSHVLRLEDFGNQFQIPNGLPNRYAELVSVDDAGERRTCSRTPMRNHQQVLVLTEKHAAKPGCSVQKRVIVKQRRAILFSREHIDAA